MVALGPGANRFLLGDRVMAVVGGGGQAERLVVHERGAMPVPEGMTWEQAGGLPEVFTTAHDASVLPGGAFHGAGPHPRRRGWRRHRSGPVGARRRGVGDRDRPQPRPATGGPRARWVGARRYARRTAGDMPVLQVVEPEGFGEHGPFDVILELVGGPNLDADVRALATDGRVSVIGVGAGAKGEVNLLNLMGVRGRIMASTLWARPFEGKADVARAVERNTRRRASRPAPLRSGRGGYAMAEAESAYERFAAGGKFGKIVLTSDV